MREARRSSFLADAVARPWPFVALSFLVGAIAAAGPAGPAAGQAPPTTAAPSPAYPAPYPGTELQSVEYPYPGGQVRPFAVAGACVAGPCPPRASGATAAGSSEGPAQAEPVLITGGDGDRGPASPGGSILTAWDLVGLTALAGASVGGAVLALRKGSR